MELLLHLVHLKYWKLPVFVKNGAIIPMANPSNNVSEINPNLRIYELTRTAALPLPRMTTTA